MGRISNKWGKTSMGVHLISGGNVCGGVFVYFVSVHHICFVFYISQDKMTNGLPNWFDL